MAIDIAIPFSFRPVNVTVTNSTALGTLYTVPAARYAYCEVTAQVYCRPNTFGTSYDVPAQPMTQRASYWLDEGDTIELFGADNTVLGSTSNTATARVEVNGSETIQIESRGIMGSAINWEVTESANCVASEFAK